MRWAVFFLFVLTLTFVLADNKSSTQSNFNIAGCLSPNIPINTCSSDGRFYCGLDLVNHETVQSGCMMGKTKTTFVPGTDPQCCLDGYKCNPDSDKCEIILCSMFTDMPSCENSGCVWFNDGVDESCREDLDDFGCGVYRSSSACNSDVYNLGQEGWRTGECSGAFVDCDISFVINGCGCEWNIGENKCVLSKNITQEIFGNSPIMLQCKESWSSDQCVDGKRNVAWISNLIDISSGVSPTSAQLQCLQTKTCSSGSEIVECGKPLLKLPGFSLFAFIFSLAVIFAIYYLRKNN